MQSHGVHDGPDKIQAAIRSLAEPLRYAIEEVATAQTAWQILTPHHHLFTYDAEVTYLTDEWKSFRNLCQQMEQQIDNEGYKFFRRAKAEKDSLGRLRAQLAAVDVRLNVLEAHRKASSVVDVHPADVVFAGKNLKTAQEWLTTLRAELDGLESIRDQIRHNKAA